MLNLIKKIVGTKNEREIRRLQPLVERINSLEPEFERLTNAELKLKTDDFKKRIGEATASLRRSLEEAEARAAAETGERREDLKAEAEDLAKDLREAENDVLAEILPEAFAAVRESSRRTTG